MSMSNREELLSLSSDAQKRIDEEKQFLELLFSGRERVSAVFEPVRRDHVRVTLTCKNVTGSITLKTIEK